jgi:Spy/CpxP family protein refolding chaperone
MKRIGIVLAVIGLLCAFTATITLGQATDEPKKERPGPRQGVRGGDRADAGGWMRGGINEWIIRRVVNDPKTATEIGLSEEQIKALKDAAEQIQKQREDLQKQLAEVEQQLKKLMEENPVDENAVLAAVEKAGKIRLEMEKAGIKYVLLAKKTLTAEQLAKIKEMMQQQGKKRAEGEKEKGDKGANKTE